MKNLKNTAWQFIKFNLVGIMNTSVDFVVFTALTAWFGVYYLLAQVISYACGIANSYVFNTLWTFKQEKKRTTKEFALFVCVNLVSLGVSLLVLYVCKNVFHIEKDLYCKLIATPIALAVNFIGNKLFVFKAQPKEDEVPQKQ